MRDWAFAERTGMLADHPHSLSVSGRCIWSGQIGVVQGFAAGQTGTTRLPTTVVLLLLAALLNTVKSLLSTLFIQRPILGSADSWNSGAVAKILSC